MKAILEFNLPEDHDDHLLAVHASDMWCVLWDLDQQKLRDMLKYRELSEDAYEAVEEIREYFHSLLEDHGLSLDMVN